MQRSGYSSEGSGGSLNLTPFSLGSVPVVRAVLVGCTAVFVTFFFILRNPASVLGWLGFQIAPGSIPMPWTVLTYPLVVLDIVNLIFSGFFFYMVGGSLERSWGWRNFAVLFAAFVAIGALALVPAAYLFKVPLMMAGLWVPSVALLVAWAALDPDMKMNLYGVLPVPIKYVALGSVLILFFTHGGPGPFGPIIGFFYLAAPAAAFFYVRKMPRLNIGFRASQPVRRRPAPLLREQPPRETAPRERVPGSRLSRKEQEEIERLKRLLGEDDDRPSRKH